MSTCVVLEVVTRPRDTCLYSVAVSTCGVLEVVSRPRDMCLYSIEVCSVLEVVSRPGCVSMQTCKNSSAA